MNGKNFAKAPYFSYISFMKNKNQTGLDFIVDKLTNSIENVVSGDIFDTDVFQLFANDTSQIKKEDWQFKWKEQLKNNDRETYKLVIKDNPNIIQGLLSCVKNNEKKDNPEPFQLNQKK